MEPTTYPPAEPVSRRPRTVRRGRPAQHKDRYWLHLLLFLLTVVSTTFAGGQLIGRMLLYEQAGPPLFSIPLGGAEPFPVYLGLILDGLAFGLSLLAFLTVHEFGHYFAARAHRVSTSLPYYIPFPFNGIGTFGAVIRIRQPVPSLRKLFDIGAAGPLAGFVVALGVLLYALATLPPPAYVLDLPGHEALKQYIQLHGTFPDRIVSEAPVGTTLVVGQTPLYWILTQFFADVPPMYEMYHYPVLFAGWLGLFFTALNLLPVGQLDGGHILYALVGPRWHARLAQGFVVLLLASGGIGFMQSVPPLLYAWNVWAGRLSWFLLAGMLYFFLNRVYKGDHRLIAPALAGLVVLAALAQAVGGPLAELGYTGWLVWCLLIVFLVRVEHPPVLYHEPLTPGRRALGVLSMIIFLLCFSLKPLYVV